MYKFGVIALRNLLILIYIGLIPLNSFAYHLKNLANGKPINLHLCEQNDMAIAELKDKVSQIIDLKSNTFEIIVRRDWGDERNIILADNNKVLSDYGLENNDLNDATVVVAGLPYKDADMIRYKPTGKTSYDYSFLNDPRLLSSHHCFSTSQLIDNRFSAPYQAELYWKGYSGCDFVVNEITHYLDVNIFINNHCLERTFFIVTLGMPQRHIHSFVIEKISDGDLIRYRIFQSLFLTLRLQDWLEGVDPNHSVLKLSECFNPEKFGEGRLLDQKDVEEFFSCLIQEYHRQSYKHMLHIIANFFHPDDLDGEGIKSLLLEESFSLTNEL